MGLFGRLLGSIGAGVAREVQPNVFEARVTSMTHDGQQVTDLRDMIPVKQAMLEHMRTCELLEPHSVMLVVQHQPFPWGQAQSYVYLRKIDKGVWPVFVLTRETGVSFMMDPRLGDRWGELQLHPDSGLRLVVDNNPVHDSYYNYE